MHDVEQQCVVQVWQLLYLGSFAKRYSLVVAQVAVNGTKVDNVEVIRMAKAQFNVLEWYQLNAQEMIKKQIPERVSCVKCSLDNQDPNVQPTVCLAPRPNLHRS